ncbi:MAG TPA: hypothetical protein VF278_19760 [Pirellulales bacterium]
MAMHTIEPGQRLQTLVGDQIRFVQVVAEAVVPAGYWLCRDEPSGQSRVIAQTALEPIPVEPVAMEPVAMQSIAVEPIAVQPVAMQPIAMERIDVKPNGAGPIEQIAPLPAVTAEAVITAAA